MFKPFQSPLLKNVPPFQRPQVPPAKRRRLNDEATSKKSIDRHPRTEGLDLLRKPLLAVTNPGAGAATTAGTEPQDDSMEGYYTVLWCSIPACRLRCQRGTDSAILGANPRTRSTRHGTATALSQLSAAMPTSRTYPAERWVERRATRLTYRDRRCR